MELEHRPPTREELLTKLTESYSGVLSNIGEDVTREGLLKTPQRAAKAMLYFTKGYDQTIKGEPYDLLNKQI